MLPEHTCAALRHQAVKQEEPCQIVTNQTSSDGEALFVSLKDITSLQGTCVAEPALCRR